MQFFNIEHSRSNYRDLLIGVPQGSVMGPVLYLIYTIPISEVIKKHKLNYHLYAHVTQLYVAFKNDDIDSITDRIVDCVSDICLRMERNELKLKKEKTDILLIHSEFRNSPSLDEIILGNEQLTMARTVTNLGIIFDREISFNYQINQLCRTSFFLLRNLFKIRKYLTDEATSKVVHAFVTTKLEYCNHLYFGLPKYQVNKMQRVQNTAARLATRSSKHDHITPLLQQLHWLPVSYRIVFKILLLVYKARHGLCPGYVSELLQERKSSPALRSSSPGLLATPTSRTKTNGERTFSVSAPKLWNGLPNHVRNVGTLPFFKKNRKTFFILYIYRQLLSSFLN